MDDAARMHPDSRLSDACSAASTSYLWTAAAPLAPARTLVTCLAGCAAISNILLPTVTSNSAVSGAAAEVVAAHVAWLMRAQAVAAQQLHLKDPEELHRTGMDRQKCTLIYFFIETA